MDFPQAAALDMGVDLGGADVGVAEQLLDDPQIGAVFQQVRCKAVAQRVWTRIKEQRPEWEPHFGVSSDGDLEVAIPAPPRR